ncbi:MAG: hypothetical protein GY842_26425 [bacterium]|nr:hypothetical protein [bacterium]
MSRLGKEDEFFLAQELQQRTQLRVGLEAKAKAEAERRKIAKHVGLSDDELAHRIQALGFEGETTRVLHLMPLVEVAWSDGALSAAERKVILRAANAHGIEPHTPAGVFLASLLEERPSDAVLEEILEVLKDILRAKSIHPKSVLDACLDVAGASGGFLGLGDKISTEERTIIEQITAAFGADAQKCIAEKLG